MKFRRNHLNGSAAGMMFFSKRYTSGRLGDFTSFNAARADLHTLSTTSRALNPNGLKIRLKATLCTIVSMRHIVAELRTFTANFTTLSHLIDYLRVL
jgi:hypothetical protein